MRMNQLSLYSHVQFISASSLQVITLSLRIYELTGAKFSALTHTSCSIMSIVGSTDCVCYATVGVVDPITSALHIIIGKEVFPLK